MTAKKETTTKGTTFGDEEVVDDTVVEPEATEEAPKVEEKAKEAKPDSWSTYEASVREEFVGFLHGRKVEEAIRFVKKGWDAAGGK